LFVFLDFVVDQTTGEPGASPGNCAEPGVAPDGAEYGSGTSSDSCAGQGSLLGII
jgi:hypothetical protein